jgi:hypothetical protein
MKYTLTFALALSLAFVAKAADPAYDKATVVEVSGTVTAVREVPKGNPLPGIHLTLQAESKTLDIYVGPTEFVKMFEVTFKNGDNIRAIGSKVKFEDATVVLAREVTMGEVTLSCRDNNGEPLWKYFFKST